MFFFLFSFDYLSVSARFPVLIVLFLCESDDVREKLWCRRCIPEINHNNRFLLQMVFQMTYTCVSLIRMANRRRRWGETVKSSLKINWINFLSLCGEYCFSNSLAVYLLLNTLQYIYSIYFSQVVSLVNISEVNTLHLHTFFNVVSFKLVSVLWKHVFWQSDKIL